MTLELVPDKELLRVVVHEAGHPRWSLLTPENVMGADFNAGHVHLKPHEWQPTKTGYLVTQQLPEQGIKHRTDISKVDPDTLELTYTLENSGAAPLQDVRASFCFACAWHPWGTTLESIEQSWVDPAFHGPRKEKNTDWTDRTLVPTRLGLIAVGGINRDIPVARSRAEAGDEEADMPIILCQSVDRTATYAAGFERAATLSCAVNSCIHVIPLVGQVEPGESVVLRGRFYYAQSDPYEVIGRFLRDFDL